MGSRLREDKKGVFHRGDGSRGGGFLAMGGWHKGREGDGAGVGARTRRRERG